MLCDEKECTTLFIKMEESERGHPCPARRKGEIDEFDLTLAIKLGADMSTLTSCVFLQKEGRFRLVRVSAKRGAIPSRACFCKKRGDSVSGVFPDLQLRSRIIFLVAIKSSRIIAAASLSRRFRTSLPSKPCSQRFPRAS